MYTLDISCKKLMYNVHVSVLVESCKFCLFVCLQGIAQFSAEGVGLEENTAALGEQQAE